VPLLVHRLVCNNMKHTNNIYQHLLSFFPNLNLKFSYTAMCLWWRFTVLYKSEVYGLIILNKVCLLSVMCILIRN